MLDTLLDAGDKVLSKERRQKFLPPWSSHSNGKTENKHSMEVK